MQKKWLVLVLLIGTVLIILTVIVQVLGIVIVQVLGIVVVVQDKVDLMDPWQFEAAYGGVSL